jgi:ABC-2 type transport system ATP-binding protein
MDEPTSGLDPIVRRELLEKLRVILQDEQKSILFSTHITSDLERIADYITCVHRGQIVFSSPREEILQRWGVLKSDQQTLSGGLQRLLRGTRQGVHGCEALIEDVEAARAVLPSQAVIEKASLDDIVVLLQQEKGTCSP